MVKLSNRLKTIANFIPKGSYVADVGADHGKLGIYLLTKGIARRVQSIENKPGPFVSMKSNYEQYGMTNKVDLSLSNGISNLNNNVDCVVIAGIGGLLTLKILNNNKEKLLNVSTLIVDPHRDIYKVRKEITSMGYIIEDEKLIFEDKIYYSIIKFSKSNKDVVYSEDELLFGPILLKNKDELFTFYLKDQLAKIDKIISSKIPNSKVIYYKKLIERIEKYL